MQQSSADLARSYSPMAIDVIEPEGGSSEDERGVAEVLHLCSTDEMIAKSVVELNM